MNLLTTKEEAACFVQIAIDRERSVAIRDVDTILKMYIQDILQIVKNINTTSMNESDRVQRLIEFEQKYGISNTHLL